MDEELKRTRTVLTVAGKGEARFPTRSCARELPETKVSFNRYYKYDEMTEVLEQLCEEYPHLASVESIGKSYEGRDVWVMTITDTETGMPEDKPAYYIDANHHAGEVTGSMVALYTIVHLLDNHGRDDSVTRLLEHFTLYIVPRVSPDGSERYLTTADMLRSSVRPWPARGDDEHGGLRPEDVDGNGIIVQMRVESPSGAWRVSGQDPRLMVLREPDDADGPFYDLFTEGVIDNFDGAEVRPKPPRWGLDLNRNYPMGWKDETGQRGAGPFPLSEPETYNVARFFEAHRNIAGVTSYHTTGGVILRPLCTGPDSDMNMSDLRIYQHLGDRGEELTGYPCESVWDAMTLDKKRPSHGSFIDFAYEMHGVIAFAPELWNLRDRADVPRRSPKERFMLPPREREEDDLKVLRWIDENSPESFLPWTAFDHPQLGEVEIGGMNVKYVSQNPPRAFLEQECRKNMLASLVNAAALPRLELTEFDSERLADGLYRVWAVVRNAGWLPTRVTSRGTSPQTRPPRGRLVLPDGVQLVMGDMRWDIGHLDGGAAAGLSSVPDRVRRAEWLIRCTDDVGQVSLEVAGDRSGTVRATLDLD